MTDKTEFNPDYPPTLDDAIEMLVGMFEEEVEKQTDETKGYKAGLLMGINILDTLKRISSKNEIDATTPEKPDLQQFTPEEIEDCRENLEGMSIVLRDAAQIIKQLQEELATRLQGYDGD